MTDGNELKRVKMTSEIEDKVGENQETWVIFFRYYYIMMALFGFVEKKVKDWEGVGLQRLSTS